MAVDYTTPRMVQLYYICRR